MKRDAFVETERARSALQAIDPGADRDTWVRVAMGAKAAGLEFEDFHEWSAQGANYRGESDCRSTWGSIKDGAVTSASLFRIALSQGWRDGEKRPAKRIEKLAEKCTALSGKYPKEETSVDAEAVWNACKPASIEHGYVAKKKGIPDGLRVYHGPLKIAGKPCDGALVLPATTPSGKLLSLQFVTDGGKLFLPRHKLSPDACLVLGRIEAGKPVYLAEGIGQAWSANKATGCATVVCFGWGRLAGVATAIKDAYPDAHLVIVPDAGKEAEAAAVARKLNCQFVELPSAMPRNGDINDIEQAEGIDAVRRLLASAKAVPQRFELLSPAELVALPPVRWLVRGVLPQEGIAAIYGPPGSGKSFLVLDLLAHIAGGREWFGNRVVAAPVVYIGLEGEAGIAQRIQAWQASNGLLPEGFRAILQSLDIRKPDERAELVQAIKNSGLGGGVVVVDTLNRAAPGVDENSSEQMGEVIAALKELQAELCGVVLAVHHSGKDASKGLRGHSSLLAALDASIEVSRDGERREWRTAKSKDGEDGKAYPFRLSVVELGDDEHGDAVTSCVCLPEQAASEMVSRTKVPAGGNQRIVWDALGELLREEGKRTGGGKPDDAPDECPVGRPCIRLADAIAGCRDRLAVEPGRKTERTRAAITGMAAKGLIVIRNDWLWCA